MALIPLIVEIAKLAVVAIILWYVVEQIAAMPKHMRLVVQALIALICILWALALVVGPGPAASRALSSPMPSIMKQ